MGHVYTGYDPVRAHAVRNFLELAGIPAAVVAELLFPLRGTGASLAFLPEVWVIDDKDTPRARKLIEEHDVPTCHPAPLWVRLVALFLLLSPLSAAALSLADLLASPFG